MKVLKKFIISELLASGTFKMTTPKYSKIAKHIVGTIDDIIPLINLLLEYDVIQKRQDEEKNWNIIELNTVHIIELNANEKTQLNNALKLFNIDWYSSTMKSKIIPL
eukprot:422813_1